MIIDLSISDEDLKRIFLALLAHRREMINDGYEDSFDYERLNILIRWFQNKADRLGIELD